MQCEIHKMICHWWIGRSTDDILEKEESDIRHSTFSKVLSSSTSSLLQIDSPPEAVLESEMSELDILVPGQLQRGAA